MNDSKGINAKDAVEGMSPDQKVSMQTYLPSVRRIDGVVMPVLIRPSLDGEWTPPQRVYLAADVEAEIDRLREKIRILQQRDDYVTACLV